MRWSRTLAAGLLAVAATGCGPSRQEVAAVRSANATQDEQIGKLEFQAQQCHQGLGDVTARLGQLERGAVPEGEEDEADTVSPITAGSLEEVARAAVTVQAGRGGQAKRFPKRVGGLRFGAGRADISAACQGGLSESPSGEIGCVHPSAPVAIIKRGTPVWVVFFNDRAEEIYFRVDDHVRAKERLSERYGDAMGEENTVVWRATGGTIILLHREAGWVVVYLTDTALKIRTGGY